jgi:hypothetical protein
VCVVLCCVLLCDPLSLHTSSLGTTACAHDANDTADDAGQEQEESGDDDDDGHDEADDNDDDGGGGGSGNKDCRNVDSISRSSRSIKLCFQVVCFCLRSPPSPPPLAAPVKTS